jgi:hypothetical protein
MCNQLSTVPSSAELASDVADRNNDVASRSPHG